jgi:catechol 2,3-dioxygenase-like lactoylglutathione lyase family enzyme
MASRTRIARREQQTDEGAFMKTLSDVSKTPVGGFPQPAICPTMLAAGTLISRDLDVAQRFYEEFLGLECVRLSADRLIARHRKHDRASYWVLDVRKVDQVEHPQSMMNHWGVFVRTREDVDRAFELVAARKDRYGLRRIQKPRMNHGSYSFYMEDVDSNWWEIEARPEERAYGTDVANGDRYVEEATQTGGTP